MDTLWYAGETWQLFAFGFAIWYATGIDDAIVFGGVMSGAKSFREKWWATLGLLAMYVTMLLVVVLVGASLTAFFGTEVFGIPIRHIITFCAMLFVIGLGFDAWNDDGSEKNEAIESHVPSSWYERIVAAIAGFFPRIAQDAFKGFGWNCSDDITVNTSNVLGKSALQTFWYLSGNAVGVISMIVAVWAVYGLLRHFADNHVLGFNRVRAVGIFFAAFLIFRSVTT